MTTFATRIVEIEMIALMDAVAERLGEDNLATAAAAASIAIAPAIPANHPAVRAIDAGARWDGDLLV